jgi:hypothetical protein
LAVSVLDPQIEAPEKVKSHARVMLHPFQQGTSGQWEQTGPPRGFGRSRASFLPEQRHLPKKVSPFQDGQHGFGFTLSVRVLYRTGLDQVQGVTQLTLLENDSARLVHGAEKLFFVPHVCSPPVVYRLWL